MKICIELQYKEILVAVKRHVEQETGCDVTDVALYKESEHGDIYAKVYTNSVIKSSGFAI